MSFGHGLLVRGGHLILTLIVPNTDRFHCSKKSLAAYRPGLFWLRPPSSSRTHHREAREAYQRSVDELRVAQKSTTSAGGLSEPL